MTVKIEEDKRSGLTGLSLGEMFEGHLLRLNDSAAVVMVSASSVIVLAVSGIFSFMHLDGYTLVLWALLPGGMLGLGLLILERLLAKLKNYMFPQMEKLLTAFLLFFLHIIGYLAFSSMIVTYPLGQIINKVWETPGLAAEYSMFSANFFIVLGLLSWFRNVRSGVYRCF